MALNNGELKAKQFTHVLNCVDRVEKTTHKIRHIKYLGINTFDLETFDISIYFRPTAAFIHAALEEGGKQFSFKYLSNTTKDLCH